MAIKSSKTTLHVVGAVAGVTLFGSFLYSVVASSSLSLSTSSQKNNQALQQQLKNAYQNLYQLELSSYRLNSQINQLSQTLAGASATNLNINIPTPNISMPPVTQTVTSASGMVY